MNITATLIGQSIVFLVFVLFCMKYVWPPVMAALDARNKKIADGLAAAERGNKDLELAQERATSLIKKAKDQAAEIIVKAEKRGSELVEEAKADARTESARIVSAAQAEIEQEANQAKEQLRSQVVTLAIAGAKKVLEKEIDESSHNDLLTKLAAQM